MSKSKNKSTTPASGPKTYTKPTSLDTRQHANSSSQVNEPSEKKSALDEIDTLFAAKKQYTKEAKQKATQQQEQDKLARMRRKAAKLDEERDELMLRGATAASVASGSITSGAKRNNKADAKAPQSLHDQARTLKGLTYTRSDLTLLNNADNLDTNVEQTQKWAEDGLGGIFNGEGYTGRKDEGGHRVFKAHLMNREGFGNSKDCPFDCDCCYI